MSINELLLITSLLPLSGCATTTQDANPPVWIHAACQGGFSGWVASAFSTPAGTIITLPNGQKIIYSTAVKCQIIISNFPPDIQEQQEPEENTQKKEETRNAVPGSKGRDT